MFWQRKSSDLASVDDFLKQDYSIENYNSYSYYLFPSLNEGLQDFNINKSNIIKANLNDFSDLNNDFTKYVGTNINGENITFWGEHADDMTQNELVDYISSYIEVFLKTKSVFHINMEYAFSVILLQNYYKIKNIIIKNGILAFTYHIF